MQSTEQKLREALQSISDIDDSTNHAVDASAALDRIGQIARQALALPTAAPVGDLADLPRYTAWSHLKTHGGWPEGIDRSWMKDEMGRYNDVTVSNAVIAELRAALSAGDAVDAGKFHKLFEAMDEGRASIIVEGATESIDGGEIFTDIDDALDAIDAAMRKGQL